MFNNKSISISVSDEDSDELGKMRARVRRKRPKFGLRLRGKHELARRLLRMLVKWWAVLLFLLAVGLLVFEASRIGRKPGPVMNSEVGVTKKFGFITEKRLDGGNLNRLDPTSRVVRGVRERCLRLLPPEDLQHFDIPAGEEPSSHVKNVVYLSENDTLYLREYNSLSQEHAETARFNLFTGNQTLEQRERSFKVNETTVVHCGFYSENGGFKISDKDKNYMQTCKVVVSTCAFGGGDNLYQPIGMLKTSLQKVCYVAFWDEITLATQEAEGRRIGEDHFIGKWHIVVVRDLPFTDQRLNGKIPKMLGHRLFPHARYSIWVDSKSQFRRDPLSVIEALLWRSKSVLAISEHGARSNVYDEANAVIKKNKATPEEVEVQLTQYRHDGLPAEKRFNGKKGSC
ncbi:probable hexosyltransferase MUCI70 isoform X2 [Malania oleifera]|uniref:probable hexosyltransferase MUCI70 isoform X2 n=1 Tax=Malania oleifera TaxID=397392 RepID=UPI0025ADB263|nr:probable hexosyltransferase MUCI70 isoform X2 [Malania oleifera]